MAEKTEQKPLTRTLTGFGEVYSDTYRLKACNYKRNDGLDLPLDKRTKDQFVDNSHGHFWHTVTSQGRIQAHVDAMGGHVHTVDVVKDEQGNPITQTVVLKDQLGNSIGEKTILTLKIGPARRIVSKIVAGKPRTSLEPIALYINADPQGEVKTVYDEHTHEYEYVRSAIVKMNEPSADAASVIQALQAKVPSPEAPVGIAGVAPRQE
jgi:hypothetical protein